MKCSEKTIVKNNLKDAWRTAAEVYLKYGEPCPSVYKCHNCWEYHLTTHPFPMKKKEMPPKIFFEALEKAGVKVYF